MLQDRAPSSAKLGVVAPGEEGALVHPHGRAPPCLPHSASTEQAGRERWPWKLTLTNLGKCCHAAQASCSTPLWQASWNHLCWRSWQPIHFADSSVRGVALRQSWLPDWKRAKAVGTWRNAGKLLPCEGPAEKGTVICFPLPPRSKCAQINSPSWSGAFEAFVRGAGTQITGSSRMLLSRSSWLLRTYHHLCFHGERWLKPLLTRSPN